MKKKQTRIFIFLVVDRKEFKLKNEKEKINTKIVKITKLA